MAGGLIGKIKPPKTRTVAFDESDGAPPVTVRKPAAPQKSHSQAERSPQTVDVTAATRSRGAVRKSRPVATSVNPSAGSSGVDRAGQFALLVGNPPRRVGIDGRSAFVKTRVYVPGETLAPISRLLAANSGARVTTLTVVAHALNAAALNKEQWVSGADIDNRLLPNETANTVPPSEYKMQSFHLPEPLVVAYQKLRHEQRTAGGLYPSLKSLQMAALRWAFSVNSWQSALSDHPVGRSSVGEIAVSR